MCKPAKKKTKAAYVFLVLTLIVKLINVYRKSKQLESHPSLTQYINKNKTGVTFPEMIDHKFCQYYTYRRVEESYIGKEWKPVEYTQTFRFVECKPVSDIVKLILNGGEKYLKHC